MGHRAGRSNPGQPGRVGADAPARTARIAPGFPWALPGGAAAARFDGPEALHPADGPSGLNGTKGKAHDQYPLSDTLRP